MRCAFDECNKEFEPHRHNQKYCCSECCKAATNKRIRDKYYATKMRLSGEKRICSTKGCETLLSRYTDGEICNSCLENEEYIQRKELLRIFRGI